MMRRRKRAVVPLARRLAWASAAVLAVVLGALGLVRAGRLRAGLYAETARQMAVNYRTLLSGLGPEYTSPLGLAVNSSALAGFLSSPTVGAVVVDATGTPLAVAPLRHRDLWPPVLSRQQYRAALEGDRSPFLLASSRGERFLVTLMPIGGPLGLSGLVELATPTAPLDRVVSQEVAFDVLGGALALVGVSLALYLILEQALRPLAAMAEAAQRVSQGDFGVKIPDSQVQEVAALADAFRRMVKRVEAALERERREQERVRAFVADASHSLRTPLTVLNGRLDLLLRGDAREGPALESTLRDLRAEGERMARIVQGLLLLARLESGGVPPPTAVSVVEVLRNVEPRLTSLAGDRQLTLDVAPADLTVWAPPEAVETIVTNLVENACRHTPEDGAVTVEARVVDHMARLRVWDTGSGISSVDLPHVFERFYRGRRPEGRRDGGAGLGLAIVRQWAESLGGHAEAANRTDRSGAVFTVWLPLPPPSPPAGMPAAGGGKASVQGSSPGPLLV